MATEHRPVMLEEVVAALALRGAEMVVDATFGGGGHAGRILEELGPDGRVVGIDRDPEAFGRASELLRDRRFRFMSGAYDEVLWQMVEEGRRVDAILFDLGLSSFQIDEPRRGFSYVGEGPLDMRMDPRSGLSAAEFLNAVEVEELSRVLTEYGDVPRGQARRARWPGDDRSRPRPIFTRPCGRRSAGRREVVTRRSGSSRPCACASTTSWGASSGRSQRRSGSW
jgi:16S rRNA (cytosine1402-N4)-methyltransferase